MSAQESDTPTPAAKPAGPPKVMMIMMAVSILFSLITVVLAAMQLSRPVLSRIEEGNAEMKELVSAGGSATNKRIDALRDACIDWQAVLKTASEKPEATFRIIKGEDGMLTLSEVK